MNLSEMTPQERFVFMSLQMQCGLQVPNMKDTDQLKAILETNKNQLAEIMQNQMAGIDQQLSLIENLEQGMWRS